MQEIQNAKIQNAKIQTHRHKYICYKCWYKTPNLQNHNLQGPNMKELGMAVTSVTTKLL